MDKQHTVKKKRSNIGSLKRLGVGEGKKKKINKTDNSPGKTDQEKSRENANYNF